MVKSKSLTKKVSSHIPADLTVSILSKLSLKSLVPFRCVRKSRSFLFQDSYFMNIYRINFASNRNYTYADDSCIMLEGYNTLFSLSGERFENKVKLDWPPPIQEDVESWILLDSVVDGSICFYKDLEIPKIVIWNLNTEEWKVLPPSPLESLPPYYDKVFCKMYGFGYDHVNDDYKVVRYVAHCLPQSETETDDECFFMQHDSMWEVYSLRSNIWKNLELDEPAGFFDWGVQFYTNGVCHRWDVSNNGGCLSSFDLNGYMFFSTPPPSDVHDDSDFMLLDSRFAPINGSVAFISSYENSYNIRTTFYVSILGEVGVKESWTKLFVIDSFLCFDYPIGAGNKGEIFFRSKEDEIVQVDLSTQMMKNLGIKVPLDVTTLLYKEVFLPSAVRKYF